MLRKKENLNRKAKLNLMHKILAATTFEIKKARRRNEMLRRLVDVRIKRRGSHIKERHAGVTRYGAKSLSRLFPIGFWIIESVRFPVKRTTAVQLPG